jgi:hypothetical protein
MCKPAFEVPKPSGNIWIFTHPAIALIWQSQIHKLSSSLRIWRFEKLWTSLSVSVSSWLVCRYLNWTYSYSEWPHSGIHMGKISADICAENCANMNLLIKNIFFIFDKPSCRCNSLCRCLPWFYPCESRFRTFHNSRAGMQIFYPTSILMAPYHLVTKRSVLNSNK